MALTTPNFSSTQDLSDNALINFVDTSTGTDSSITNRTIQVLLSDGTYLVPAGNSTNVIQWSYSVASLEVDLLSKSTAAAVTVIWLAGTTPIYTKTINMEWDLYDYVFLFGLFSSLTSTPDIANTANYYPNVFKMITNLWNSENAVTVMSDIYSSQNALDKNIFMINKQSLFF